MAELSGDIVLTGAEGLHRALGRLGPALEQRIITKALRAGMKPIFQAARRNAPKDTGLMKKSMAIRVRRSGKYRRYPTAEIIFRWKQFAAMIPYAGGMKEKKLVSFGAQGQRWFYPSFVEYGTDRMEARPFVRPAFDVHKEEAAQIVISRAWIEIQKEWAKP